MKKISPPLPPVNLFDLNIDRGNAYLLLVRPTEIRSFRNIVKVWIFSCSGNMSFLAFL